jgi:entericidin B
MINRVPLSTAKALAMVTLFATAALLGGCNTTSGAGQDLSAGGRAITNTADKVKSGL